MSSGLSLLAVSLVLLAMTPQTMARCCKPKNRSLFEFQATCYDNHKVSYWKCCSSRGSCNFFCCNCDGDCRGGEETAPGGLLIHDTKSLFKIGSDISSILSSYGRRKRETSIEAAAEKELLTELVELENFNQIDGIISGRKDLCITVEEALVSVFGPNTATKLEEKENKIPDWFLTMDTNQDGIIEPSEFDHDLAFLDEKDCLKTGNSL